LVEKEITLELKHLEIIALICFLSFVFFLELQLTLSSPISFGDEGYHTRMAQWIAQEKEIPVWNPFEGDNVYREGFTRPFLWNSLEASFFYVFGFNDTIVKILTPFIGSVFLGLAVFVVFRRIYNENIALFASIFAVAIPSIITYSIFFYDEILLVIYFLLSVSCLIFAVQTENKKYWIMTGVFAALAILTKRPGYFLIPIFGITFLYELLTQKNFLKIIKRYLILLLPLLLITSTFFLRNLVYYKTPLCGVPFSWFFKSTCGIDTGKTSTYSFAGRTDLSGTESSVFNVGIMSYLNFAYGFTYNGIYLLIFAFLGGLLLLATRRNIPNLIMIFSIITFLLLFLFPSITTRAEDTARYLLAWAPLIALIAGIYFSEIYDFIKKYLKSFAVIIFVVILILSFIEVQTKLVGLKPVKAFSTYFFDACNWVKQHPDKVPENSIITTVWTHRTAYNCQRDVTGGDPDFVVSGNASLALSTMKERGITHVFIQKFSISTQNLSENYPWQYVQMLENNPKIFEKIFENGEPDLTKCSSGNCDGTIIYKVNYTA